jgi:N-acetylneuraminate synthase
MTPIIQIGLRQLGAGHPVYMVAELSANHRQDFSEAVRLIESAKNAGADAIKLQTYTPDTITINSRNKYFQVGDGSIWTGRNLYELYSEAYTPWEWHPKLKEIANALGLDFFSTPFDITAVDFLESINVPFYKVASLEIVDLPLIRRIAQTGKPVIVSTGTATLSEIDEAVSEIRNADNEQIALLKCTSSYPAPPEEMNLRTIPHMMSAFDLPIGLSDHSMGIAVPVAAVTFGACIVEKHLTLSRDIPGPDSAFSLEPNEFKAMVDAVRVAERAMGSVQYGATAHEATSLIFRRSLFVVKDIKIGEVFSSENVRSIRPGHGLHPREFDHVVGRIANENIASGTPLIWDLVGGKPDFRS